MLPITNPLSLYAIMDEHVQLLNQVMENDGEVTPELDAALHLNGYQLQQKAISLGYVLKTLELNATVLKTEIDRLTNMLKRAEKAHEGIKKKLGEALIYFGVERLDGGNIKLFFRKSEQVSIVRDTDVPEEYYEQPPPVISKTKIRQALKSGIEVPGATLLTKQNLQIK